MLLAYNTNGLAHHDPLEAIQLLAELGYEGVGLTIDHGMLDPREPVDRHAASMLQLRQALARFRMRSVVETGARFLLDPQCKHEPTLMTSDAGARRRRIDFLRHAIRVAAELQSDCVSIWSGILHPPQNGDQASDDAAFDRLIEGLAQICDFAASQGVLIGFEPEPGMFIDSMRRYEELLARFDHPALRLTIDIGHLHCLGETPIAETIRHWASRLVNVHIEDMRTAMHEHLMFGEGEIDFPPVLQALLEINYGGLLQVELSRHSHDGAEAARRAIEFLRPMLTADTPHDFGGHI